MVARENERQKKGRAYANRTESAFRERTRQLVTRKTVEDSISSGSARLITFQ